VSIATSFVIFFDAIAIIPENQAENLDDAIPLSSVYGTNNSNNFLFKYELIGLFDLDDIGISQA